MHNFYFPFILVFSLRESKTVAMVTSDEKKDVTKEIGEYTRKSMKTVYVC